MSTAIGKPDERPVEKPGGESSGKSIGNPIKPNIAVRVVRACGRICRQVPLLPITILSAFVVAGLWDWRPWGRPFWGVDPSVGQWLVIVLVVYTVIDTLRGMIDDIRHGHVGVDVLAVVAILSTLAVQEYWASWAVVLMISSGEAIEEYAQAKAESSLTALMEAAPQTAHVVNLPGVVGGAAGAAGAADGVNLSGGADGAAAGGADVGSLVAGAGSADGANPGGGAASHLRTVPVERVRRGDVLQVLPGETVPVDGELLSGSATLDLSNINGEPMPREVFVGARVMSGAVNGATMLTMRATELSRDSQYQRILELVRSAQSSRATVVKTADLLAVPFTVVSFIIACAAWIISGVPTRFAQVLVLATPCPLLIAAPVAYMAGTGRLAKAGILIKAQEVLENLGRVSHIFFDKTGTLTVKKPQVVRVDKPVGVVAVPSGVGADAVAGAGSAEAPCVVGVSGASGAAQPSVSAEQVRPRSAALNEDHILMFAGVVESYSVHILAKGIAKAGAAAVERLHAKYDSGQRNCPENGRPGHGRAYPVVRHIEEDAGNGVSGEVDGHTVRVGRFGFVTAGMRGMGAVAEQFVVLPGASASSSASVSASASASASAAALAAESVATGATGSSDPSDSSPSLPERAERGFRAVSASVSETAAARSSADSGPRGVGEVPRSTGFRKVLKADRSRSAAVSLRERADKAAARARNHAMRDALFPSDHFADLAPDEMAAYVAVDGRLVARIVLKDVPRANARESLERLRSLGVNRLSMLTGDKAASANVIAAEVGIDDVKSELFPEDKVAAVRAATDEQPRKQPWWDRALQRFVGESTTKSVTMMVGDGVNDAPVLAVADIGMAITDGTSTAASQSAQVVIMNDDIAAVPNAVAIARRTKRVMMQAVLLGLGLALVGMVCAAFNLIPVVVGAFMQEAIDVVSILWALTALVDRD
ncbi:heavy metal translocating P-type ATPase [Bifidobacterium primatium]|uniref:Heavy metal translocating P-type ATPase n=1 Tax=Bifidobacterium primatium TaxID=2045438 RepID=A0A2M9HBJ3_9BIFI|nr:HAD-IC family P-type ATPase [Bifidobacterium primatium]PJM74178.1 heavy metal translocating P-type ATPase [Bifidobacterium primatium]